MLAFIRGYFEMVILHTDPRSNQLGSLRREAGHSTWVACWSGVGSVLGITPAQSSGRRQTQEPPAFLRGS